MADVVTMIGSAREKACLTRFDPNVIERVDQKGSRISYKLYISVLGMHVALPSPHSSVHQPTRLINLLTYSYRTLKSAIKPPHA